MAITDGIHYKDMKMLFALKKKLEKKTAHNCRLF